MVHGVALKAANLNGLFVVAMIDAGAFAKDIHGTDTRATGAENIGVEDGERGAGEVSLRDFLDETRNVNVRGAGGGAGSVEAVETAVGFDESGLGIERRMELREATEQFGVFEMRLLSGHIKLQ
jgi:hypothetical protein